MVARGDTAILGGSAMNDLLLRRRIAAINSTPSLPYDAEIEYLESNGTQYIDTGYKHNGDSRFVCKFNASNVVNYTYVFGSFGSTSSDANTRAIFTLELVDVVATYYRQRKRYEGISSNGTHTCDLNKNVHKVDNSTYTFTKITMQSNYNTLLFGVTDYSGNPNLKTTNIKIYYFKIYDNGTLIRDFIPVRVGTTGYMYDKVSGTLFGNSGTGDFILGNDIT